MTRLNLLVVDGGNHIRDAILRSFDNQQFEVVSASTSSEALGLVATQHFDLVITCLQVRRAGDGFVLVAAIRHLQPEARIVAVSDSLDTQEAIMAIRLQVDVIATPFNVRQVAELIYPQIVGPKFPSGSDTEEWDAHNSRTLA
jgi:DNA-binding NtrC family response regulator